MLQESKKGIHVKLSGFLVRLAYLLIALAVLLAILYPLDRCKDRCLSWLAVGTTLDPATVLSGKGPDFTEPMEEWVTELEPVAVLDPSPICYVVFYGWVVVCFLLVLGAAYVICVQPLQSLIESATAAWTRVRDGEGRRSLLHLGTVVKQLAVVGLAILVRVIAFSHMAPIRRWFAAVHTRDSEAVGPGILAAAAALGVAIWPIACVVVWWKFDLLDKEFDKPRASGGLEMVSAGDCRILGILRWLAFSTVVHGWSRPCATIASTGSPRPLSRPDRNVRAAMAARSDRANGRTRQPADHARPYATFLQLRLSTPPSRFSQRMSEIRTPSGSSAFRASSAGSSKSLSLA